MKHLKNIRYTLSMMAACAALGMATDAKAQTVTVDTDVQVTNTLTVVAATPLNFGEIAAISAAANTATVAISSAGVVGAPTTTGGTAYIAIIDAAAATRARVTVADGAPGATLNVNIPVVGVINPAIGPNAFTLAGFSTAWNGTAAVARTAGTPWTQVFDGAFNAGVNQLDIGASITTQTSVATYGDGAYDGGFDVTFSY